MKISFDAVLFFDLVLFPPVFSGSSNQPIASLTWILYNRNHFMTNDYQMPANQAWNAVKTNNGTPLCSVFPKPIFMHLRRVWPIQWNARFFIAFHANLTSWITTATTNHPFVITIGSAWISYENSTRTHSTHYAMYCTHTHATFNLFDGLILPRAILIVWHVSAISREGKNGTNFSKRDKFRVRERERRLR